MVRMRDVEFSYRSRSSPEHRFRLSIEDWAVARGERWAVVGPSGSGKSTLLNLVAGILAPDSGRLEVGGLELRGASDGARRAHRIRTIGFVFQDFPLVEYLDSVENVLLPYRLNRALRLDARARERARDLLTDVGLESRLSARPAQLSQGERQRVALARALVTEPALLLADEPTAGLDREQSNAVLGQLETTCEQRQLTLLMVTHDDVLSARFDNALDLRDIAGPRPGV